MVAPAPFPWSPYFLASPGHNSQLPERAGGGAALLPVGLPGQGCVWWMGTCVSFAFFSPPRSCICVDVLFSGSWKGECLMVGSRPPLPKGCSLVLGDQGSSKALFLLGHSSRIPRNPPLLLPTHPNSLPRWEIFPPHFLCKYLTSPAGRGPGRLPLLVWMASPHSGPGGAADPSAASPGPSHTLSYRPPAAPASQARPACPAQA